MEASASIPLDGLAMHPFSFTDCSNAHQRSSVCSLYKFTYVRSDLLVYVCVFLFVFHITSKFNTCVLSRHLLFQYEKTKLASRCERHRTRQFLLNTLQMILQSHNLKQTTIIIRVD